MPAGSVAQPAHGSSISCGNGRSHPASGKLKTNELDRFPYLSIRALGRVGRLPHHIRRHLAYHQAPAYLLARHTHRGHFLSHRLLSIASLLRPTLTSLL